MTDKQMVVEAVNYLVASPSYATLHREIIDIVRNWEDHPRVYAGKLTILNALIDVGVANKIAFDKLMELAARKRGAVPEMKRRDYQRDLMNERRQRLRDAVELQELLKGPLNAAAKKKYQAEVQKRWMDERNRFVRAKGKLSWKERNAAAQQFWAQVDRQLEMNLEAARHKARKTSR